MGIKGVVFAQPLGRNEGERGAHSGDMGAKY